MIWTSRYANKELLKEKYYCVGISIGAPRFKLGYPLRKQCYALAPKGYMLHMEKEPYEQEYYAKLENIGKGKIIGIVRGLQREAEAEGKELVLLCFEDVRKEEDWCHRTMFAKWWQQNTSEVIRELEDPSPVPAPKKPKKKQEPDTPQKKDEKPAEESQYEQLNLIDMALLDDTNKYPGVV